ncbi:hypothetical protein [Marinoscillum sp.]|uniref:hypothetical protein n=1 Tax=Marinoscillum sp. TaxID=2024838 RepID=UPI003BAA637E
MSNIYFKKEKDLHQSLLETNEDGITLLQDRILEYALGQNEEIHGEVSISSEFNAGDAGYIDLLCYHHTTGDNNKYFDIHIVELKRNELNLNVAGQVLRYLHFIERYLQTNDMIKLFCDNGNIRFHTHVVGQTYNFNIDTLSVMRYLFEKLNFNMHFFKFDPFDGLVFKQHRTITPMHIDIQYNMEKLIEAFIDSKQPEVN